MTKIKESLLTRQSHSSVFPQFKREIMRAQNIYRKKFTRANILFPENINTEYTKTHILLAQTQLQKLAKPQYMHKQIFVL